MFSVLISNFDDHLQNHGFLHAGQGQWRLAPAFDLNPMPDRQREFKTWISEQEGPEATVRGALSIAAYCRLKAARCHEIVEEVESAVSGWRALGRELGMSSFELEQFADAFEHRQRG